MLDGGDFLSRKSMFLGEIKKTSSIIQWLMITILNPHVYVGMFDMHIMHNAESSELLSILNFYLY